MIIDCISDLHGYYPKLEGGDLLIVGGDMTEQDKIPDWKKFFEWLDKQNYKKVVYIAGNHDNFLTSACNSTEAADVGVFQGRCEYICDSGTEFEGLKIWGSPWTKRFNMHLKKLNLRSFMLKQQQVSQPLEKGTAAPKPTSGCSKNASARSRTTAPWLRKLKWKRWKKWLMSLLSMEK